MLQVIQRHALTEKWGTVKRMIKEPLIGKNFPDEAWFFQNNKLNGIT